MFRLTVVLIVGLYAAMVILGDPEPDVPVTRDDTAAAVPALANASAIPLPPAGQQASELADLSEREALEIALAAGTETRAQAAPVETTRAEAEPAVDLWYVTGSRVNLRAGPSTAAAIVGAVSSGDRAEILSDPAASWTQIRTERGLDAWIYSRFIAEAPG